MLDREEKSPALIEQPCEISDPLGGHASRPLSTCEPIDGRGTAENSQSIDSTLPQDREQQKSGRAPGENEKQSGRTICKSTADGTDAVNVENYDVLSELGAGGMGVVFKAKRQGVDNTLAIKMLHPKLVLDEASVKRFEQEAKAASFLTHPHLVAVYDFGFTEKREPFLVMDYVDGESLAAVLARQHNITPQRCISIFLQVCEALNHAHAKQIIHRDLKPNNIMLSQVEHGDADFVKIVDFGIAKLLPQADTDRDRLTQTGELIGSPVYMSPEQCLGNALDARSDIYSVGCSMYEALAGRPPCLGDNVVQTILEHLNGVPLPLKNVPEDLEKIVMRCLEKNPAHRYQSIEEVKEALEMVHTGTSDWRKKLLGRKVSQSQLRSYLRRFEKKTFVALTICAAVLASAWLWYSQATADTALKEFIAQAKIYDMQASFPKARESWLAAIAEAKRLNKPKKMMADLHHRLGNSYASDRFVKDSKLARSEWSIALKNLEETQGAISDRIDLLDKLTGDSFLPEYGMSAGAMPVRSRVIGCPEPQLVLDCLTDRKSNANLSSNKDNKKLLAEATSQLNCGKSAEALNKLCSISPLSMVTRDKIGLACEQLTTKIAPEEALDYLLVVQLVTPKPDVDLVVGKTASLLDKGGQPTLAQSLRQVQDGLSRRNFDDVAYYCEVARRRIDDPILGRWTAAAGEIADDYSRFHKKIDAPPEPVSEEQIALREKLAGLNRRVFLPSSYQDRGNLRALGGLYLKCGRNADAEKVYKAVVRSTDPDESMIRDIIMSLSMALMRENKYNEAYQLLQRSIDRMWNSGNSLNYDEFTDLYYQAIDAADKANRHTEGDRLARELFARIILEPPPPALKGRTFGFGGYPHEADFLP